MCRPGVSVEVDALSADARAHQGEMSNSSAACLTSGLISHNGHVPHIDLVARTRRGGVVRSALSSAPGRPQRGVHPEPIPAAMRNILFESAALRNGVRQSTIGLGASRTHAVESSAGVAGSAHGGAYRRRVRHGIAGLGRQGFLDRATAEGFPVVASQQALLAQSDVPSLHLRLNAETSGLVGPDDLALMKLHGPAGEHQPGGADPARGPGRGSRGRDARQKQPSHVIEHEPLTDPDDPLLRLPNALCTPHLGYVEGDNYEFAYGNAFDQIAAFASGAPINVRNPDVLKQDQQP